MRKVSKHLLAGSLGLAVSLSSPVVRAQAERTKAEKAAATLAEEKPERDLPTGAEDLPPPSAGELLAERARALDAREAELDQKAKDIAIAEAKLLERVTRLERLLEERKRVEKKILTRKEKEVEARLDRMREVTAKMPPENAAAYLIELPVGTASKILSGIKSRKAAAIMAALPPSKAAEIGRKYLKSGKSSRQSSLPSGAPRPSDRGPTAAED